MEVRRSMQQASSSLAVKFQQQKAHSCLRAWQAHCLEKQMHKRLVVRLIINKAQARLGSAFHAWSNYVANFRCDLDELHTEARNSVP